MSGWFPNVGVYDDEWQHEFRYAVAFRNVVEHKGGACSDDRRLNCPGIHWCAFPDLEGLKRYLEPLRRDGILFQTYVCTGGRVYNWLDLETGEVGMGRG